ncbi:hypothetical protein [Antarctobacter sp.]|uniref:hypothetical protein n=1 Tax=Antarctobacter sp. TaxID=1872577 RepID=UPI002B2698CE|nr:hypothetical protein [Antarctobacter sp.]
MRFIALLTTLWCLSGAAFAATLETDITPEMAEMGCTARLTGFIEKGDLERIQQFLETPLTVGFLQPGWNQEIMNRQFAPGLDYAPDFFFTHRLCLNSPGGSLVEAMRIVDFIRRQSTTENVGGPSGIQTGIARNDICESACAYIFLAGRFVRFVGLSHYEGWSNHVLHPLGRLGFHAPFIDSFDDTSYSGEQVKHIWLLGMAATSMISRQIANGSIFMTNDLFSEMVTYLPSEMLLVKTVGQAVRWDISVQPNLLNYNKYPYSREAFFEAACLNAAARAPTFIDLEPVSNPPILREKETVQRSVRGFIDSLSGRIYECEIETKAWDDLQSHLSFDYYVPGTLRRLENECYKPRVSLVPSDLSFECEDCAIEVDIGCLGILPPQTPIREIHMDPPD